VFPGIQFANSLARVGLTRGGISVLLAALALSGCGRFPEPRARAVTPLELANTEALAIPTLNSEADPTRRQADTAPAIGAEAEFYAPGNDRMLKSAGPVRR